MAPSAKIKAAFQAMKNIGIPEEKTKPVLKKLMKLYDKNWDHIEAESYRVLADAIFEYEDSEAANKEQKKLPLTSSDALEEDSLMVDELERPLKRSRSKYQGQTSLSHGQTSQSLSSAWEVPMTSCHVSPLSVMRNKGQLKQTDTSALIEVKQEPFTDDMVSFEPLAVVRPENTYPKAIYNTNNPTETHNDQQLEASKSVEETAKGVEVPISPTTKEIHMNEADASLKSSTTIDIAASPQGEVKICFICPSGPNSHNFRVPDLQAVFNKMEENLIGTFSNPDFSITKFMSELCKCVVDLGTNAKETCSGSSSLSGSLNGESSDNVNAPFNDKVKDAFIPVAASEQKTFSQDGGIIDDKVTRTGSSSMKGSLNVESSESVLVSSDIELTDALLALPPSEQMFCIQFSEDDDGNNSGELNMNGACVINEKSIVIEQHCVFDMGDIARGEEEVKVSLEQSNNKFPSFHYITHNVISSDADVSFSFAEIGDQHRCVSCSGNCLSSSPTCNCAQHMAGDSPYTIDGLINEAFLEECISIVRNRIKYIEYCIDCPLGRSINDDVLDPCKGHLKRTFIKECWAKCGCSKSCGNRVVQEGIKYNLQVFWTCEGKGWGLRTLEELPKGAFVCEYVGEILTFAELHNRNLSLSHDNDSYSLLLDANWGSSPLKEKALCLDAKLRGNVARFINHRCSDANLIEIPVEVETPNRQYYHVALFTARKVDAFEELTWDYGVNFDDNEYHIKVFNCLCGSEFCRNMNSSNRTKTALILP